VSRKISQETLRGRVCHGWAFSDHTQEEKDAIKHYLETGEVLESFPYKSIHKIMLEGRLG
jgi:hypothetical protein